MQATLGIGLPADAHPARRVRPPAPVPPDKPLGALQMLAALRRNPIEAWNELHFNLPMLSGKNVLGHVTVAAAPAAIRHILVDNAANYRKDDLQLRILSTGLGDGLLRAEGEAWKRTRRIVAPLFTPRQVRTFAPAMQAGADRLLARWARRGNAFEIDVSEEMTRFTYDVLAQTLFSGALDADSDAFSRAMTRYLTASGRIDPLDVLGAPDWIPRIGKIMARPALKFFEESVTGIVARRRAMIGRGETPPRDLLTALIEAGDPEGGKGLTEIEIAANIITFIGAGHETTANALTWTLYLLSQAPDIRAGAEEEADGAAAAAADSADLVETLPLIRASFEEAMRLYPPAPMLSRAAIRDDEVMDVKIPAGSLVLLPPYVLHRHRLLWRDPEHFAPERFLPENRGRIDRFAYLPFGAGPRICVGMGFAMMEAIIALAAVLKHYRLDYAGAQPPHPLNRITLRPRDGMMMRVAAR